MFKMLLVVMIVLMIAPKSSGQQALRFQVTGLENYPSSVALEVLDAQGKSLYKGYHPVAKEGDTISIQGAFTSKVAVQAYEDANRNERMDMGFFGQPVERYAFSNAAWRFLSKPRLEDQLIALSQGKYLGKLHFKEVSDR